MKRIGDAVAVGGDEGIRHGSGLAADRGEIREPIIHRIAAGPLNAHGAVLLVRYRVVHGFFPDLTRFAAIHVGNAAEERALQIAEGVAAHPLDAELGFHRIGERIR